MTPNDRSLSNRCGAKLAVGFALALGVTAASGYGATTNIVTTAGGGAKSDRIVILGNSITIHGPSAKVGWTNNFGMAASALDKDYAHLLVASLADANGKKPEALIGSLVEFERQYTNFDATAKLKRYIDFNAGLVIVAIGENVTVAKAADQAAFKAGLVKILSLLRQDGHATVFVRSCFWANAVKDGLLKQAADETGCRFVDIGALGKVEANYARSERTWASAGVGMHPGDKGMQAIADALLKAIHSQP